MLFSADALRSSAALPNENARRNRDGFPSRLTSFLFSAARCWAAGLPGTLAFKAFPGFEGGARGAVERGAASEPVGDCFSGLIATGLDKGDGFVIRLFPSDDPREGMLISLASCITAGVAWRAVGATAFVKDPSRADYELSISITNL